MVKLCFVLRRASHLSRDEFQRYWLEQHAPLVARHREVLGIRRYVQVHAIDSPANEMIRASRGAPEGCDGIAELWFDSLDALEAPASPEAAAAALELLEDERRFIDLERSPLWFSHEHVVVDDA